jgi:hypothetical protein
MSLLVAVPFRAEDPPKTEKPSARAAEEQEVDEDRQRFLDAMRERFPPLLYQDETPEQRKARLGTSEDPGPDPDEKRVWERFGKTYTIVKFPRVHASYDNQPLGWVRPTWTVNVPAEVYQETLEELWVWLPTPSRDLSNYSSNVREFYGGDPEAGKSPEPLYGIPGGEEGAAGDYRNTEYVKYTPEQLEFVKQIKTEFTEIEPAASGVTLLFEEASRGLPPGGSWRNGLAVADMNGDGLLDLVVPPQRGGVDSAVPFIFLNDGDGGWKLWNAVRWPRAYNYGTVAVADLNRDGHMDVVIAAHLTGVFVALGDGKGIFTDASAGLAADFPTRRAVLADANGDGHLDIFAITEGPSLGAQTTVAPPVKLFLNDGKAGSWKSVDVADAKRQVGGDWMTVGDFNGDGRIDVAGSSVHFHGTDLFYLQQKDRSWKPSGRGWLPFYSYYTALTSGKFSSKTRDDVILSFGRFWPEGADPELIAPPELETIVGLDRVTFDRKGNPKRQPIARWSSAKPIGAMGHGDFNGDGHRDLVYWRADTRKAYFLLGDGKGGFRTADAEGIDLPANTTYDVMVTDVNQDGLDDVIFMFEKGERAPDGTIRVWLGRGAAKR